MSVYLINSTGVAVLFAFQYDLLLTNGGDPNLPNRMGHTPAYIREMIDFAYVEISSEKTDKFYALTKKKFMDVKQ